MTTPSSRLKAARIAAGFSSAAEFSRRYNLPDSTYRAHEAGVRNLTIHAARRYAKYLPDTSWEDLMFGEEMGVRIATEIDHRPMETLSPALAGRSPESAEANFVIEELDVRAGNSVDGAKHDADGGHEMMVAQWQIPAHVVRSYTRTAAERIKIITCIGDSNEPVFRAGQRVMVDLNDRIPSPAGFFALWDGLGQVIKRLEYLPDSEPPSVAISSANPAYKERIVPLSSLVINGRVIGKWDWT